MDGWIGYREADGIHALEKGSGRQDGAGLAVCWDFDRYYDEGLTPEEAIAENRIEIEKQDILADRD